MAQRNTTSSGGQSRYGRVALTALAAFLLGLAAGGVHRAGSSSSARHESTTRSAVALDATATAPRRSATPGGFDRSRDGAVAAARAFVTTGQALLDVDPLAAEMAVRDMAAARTADAQVADTLAKLAAARAALSDGNGPIRYVQGVLAWRVDAFAASRARISVWNVGVLSRAGIAPPQASWATSDFDLVWERSGWRILKETVTPGPAPMLDASAAPSTSEELDAALAGFTYPSGEVTR